MRQLFTPFTREVSVQVYKPCNSFSAEINQTNDMNGNESCEG